MILLSLSATVWLPFPCIVNFGEMWKKFNPKCRGLWIRVPLERLTHKAIKMRCPLPAMVFQLHLNRLRELAAVLGKALDLKEPTICPPFLRKRKKFEPL
jgi:hypothetical protein